jgi:hypothetical protein
VTLVCVQRRAQWSLVASVIFGTVQGRERLGFAAVPGWHGQDSAMGIMVSAARRYPAVVCGRQVQQLTRLAVRPSSSSWAPGPRS